MKLIALFFLVVSAVSCANTAKKAEWDAFKNTDDFKKEKEIFQSRLGSKRMCMGTGLAEFTFYKNIKPDASCIYPSLKFEKWGAGNYQSWVNVYGRYWLKTLKVLQVTPEGYLIDGDEQDIFVFKYDDDGAVVDGNFLADDPNQYLFYEYAGPFSFESLAGRRTVHGFKRTKIPAQAQEKLKNYHFVEEIYSELKLWDWAEPWKQLRTGSKGS